MKYNEDLNFTKWTGYLIKSNLTDQAYYPQNVQLPTANRFFYLEKQVKVLSFAPRLRNLFNLTMHFLGNMGRGHTLAVQIKIQLD